MDLNPVKSSNAESAGYDPDTQELHVRFKSGGTYSYSGVPKEKYESLMAAPSFGSYLHQHVKGTHPHSKVG